MKVRYTSASGRLNVELEGTQKEIFSQIGPFQEVFENTNCGACGSGEVRFVVREAEDKKGKKHKYYELHCTRRDCRARLAFGQHTEGDTLFPKRKDGENWLENNGWTKFTKEDNNG